MHKSEVILIGPCGAGKSTVGKLLAEHLGLTSVSMDDLCQCYYSEALEADNPGFPIPGGRKFPLRWLEDRWKDVYALNRLLSEHKNCVFDLGAGHSIFEDERLLARAGRILDPYRNVVLMLPSSDPEESIRVLRERTLKSKSWDCMVQGFDLHDHFVRHASNSVLAKQTVYTLNKSPEQTRDEILELIARP